MGISLTDINNSSEKIQLIGFDICPYVHRTAICLKSNAIEYEQIYIDIYKEKPSWFSQYSPLGKVPILLINGDVIFESNVILFFLNDYLGGQLLPHDITEKALCQSYMAYANELQNSVAEYFSVTDKEEFIQCENNVFEKLSRVNDFIKNKRSAENKQMDLLDCCYAALFKLINTIKTLYNKNLMPDLVEINEWNVRLLGNNAVNTSLHHDYDVKMYEFIQAKGSYLAKIALH